MAQNLQLLKRRIKTSKNIAQIAKALEMIAASKIKKAQIASQNNKPYSDRITKITGKIINTIDSKKFLHPLVCGYKWFRASYLPAGMWVQVVAASCTNRALCVCRICASFRACQVLQLYRACCIHRASLLLDLVPSAVPAGIPTALGQMSRNFCV